MNWSDFFAMGGYGLYVWGSYAVTALCMGVEVILLLSRKRTLLQRLGRIGSRMNRAGADTVMRTGEIKHEDRI
jgi:heme exporter protein D